MVTYNSGNSERPKEGHIPKLKLLVQNLKKKKESANADMKNSQGVKIITQKEYKKRHKVSKVIHGIIQEIEIWS